MKTERKSASSKEWWVIFLIVGRGIENFTGDGNFLPVGENMSSDFDYSNLFQS